MNVDYKHVEVRNNEAEQQYEVRIGNQLAVLEYERQGNQIIYLHTGVPPAMEGHGIANKLAHVALEDARTLNLTVIPICPFVAAYIRHNPEYQSLLTASERARILQG